MESKEQIISKIAKERKVESMVENIAHQPLNDDLQDLSQMVYIILLEYDDDKIQDLYVHDQMNFFIARIIINQFRSSNSPFHSIYRKFRERCEDVSKFDFIDENGK